MKKRWLVLIILPLILIGLVAFLFTTQTGLGFIVSQIQRWSPGGLSIEQASGRLAGPLSIQGLSLDSAQADVAAASIDLDWRWSDLINRRLTIDSLVVDNISVKLKPIDADPLNDKESATYQLPDKLELPIELDIQNINITNTTIKPVNSENVIAIDVISLSGLATQDGAANLTLNVDSELLTLKTAISAEMKGDYPINGTLSWTLSPVALAPIVGNTVISGTALVLEIENVISEPYAVRTSAQIKDALSAMYIDMTTSAAVNDLSRIKSDLPVAGITGELRISGLPNNATIESDMRVSGILTQMIQSKFRANLSDSLITIDAFNVLIDGLPMALKSSGTVELGDTEPLVDLSINWTDAQWPLDREPTVISKSGQVALKGPPSNLRAKIDSLFGAKGRIAAFGTVTEQRMDVDLQWQDIQWPADGSQVSDMDGSLKINGAFDQYLITLLSNIDTPAVGGAQIRVSGFGSRESVTLPFVGLSALDGVLNGESSVRWAPEFTLDAKFEGSNLNPAVLAPDFPGNLGMTLKVSANTVDDKLFARLKKLEVNGTLRSYPLNIEANAESAAGRIALNQLSIKSGSTVLKATGAIADEVDLAWTLDSPDLSNLLPGATGRLKGEGTVLGALPLLAINTSLQGSAIAFKDYGVASVIAVAAIDPSPSGAIDVELKIDNAQGPSFVLSQLRSKTTGTVDDHEISFSARSNQGDIDTTINGALKDEAWRYRLTRTKIAVPKFDSWELQGKANGIVSADKRTVDGLCLGSGRAKLCADASQTNNGASMSYRLTELPVSYFRRLIPQNTRVAGTINSAGSAKLTNDNTPTAKVDVSFVNMSVDVPGSEKDFVRVLTLKPSNITTTLDQSGMTTIARVDLGRQGRFDADVSIDGIPDKLLDGKLSGRFTGNVKDISFIASLVPDIDMISGNVITDIQINGTPNRPAISGGVKLNRGALVLAAPGLSINGIDAEISAKGGTELGININANSGQGNIQIKGTAELATSPPALNLHITGEDFQVMDTLDARAAVSPDLLVNLNQQGVQVSGSVHVPTADITPKKVAAGVITVSSDQIFVSDEPAQKLQSPVSVKANVKVSFGDSVSVDALGLKARLTGDVTVKETPGKEATASGKLNVIDGTFKAYGQNLKIQKGQILYAGGPVSQPGFDIEAVRDVTSELQVGVQARGAMDSPRFNLFSTPSMTESEQMSYLVLGRPLEDNSPAENSAVRQAAMALGVAGGKLLTEKFGNKLGLDQVAIDSELRETGEQASLVVGKYLSPKLFVSYGIGLFEPVSTLKLNYTITKNIKLISETTESRSGGDIVFTFDGGN